MDLHKKNIIERIISKKVDTIKLCYYPFCNKKDDSIIKLQNLSKTDIDKILSGINIEEIFIGRYIEYGVRDTFVRISESSNKNIAHENMSGDELENKQRMFFRRENHVLFLNNEPGMFVLELYMLCEEEDLPNIINYHHNIRCNVQVHIYNSSKSIQPLRLCFTTIDEKNPSQVQTNNNKSTTYFNICRDVTIDKNDTPNTINDKLQNFFTDVISLKNKYKKNLTSIGLDIVCD